MIPLKYVRILGSNHDVVRLLWLIKYFSPALVIACSQPSGNGPKLALGGCAFGAAVHINGKQNRNYYRFTINLIYKFNLLLLHSKRKTIITHNNSPPQQKKNQSFSITHFCVYFLEFNQNQYHHKTVFRFLLVKWRSNDSAHVVILPRIATESWL